MNIIGQQPLSPEHMAGAGYRPVKWTDVAQEADRGVIAALALEVMVGWLGVGPPSQEL